MALLTQKVNVDYPAQLSKLERKRCPSLLSFLSGAFEDFLSGLKSSASATEASATSALEGLNIDEDDLSDEYDFMEDVGEQADPTRPDRRSTKRKDSRRKYMDTLQKVADRQLSEICIELDDLEAVSRPLDSRCGA